LAYVRKGSQYQPIGYTLLVEPDYATEKLDCIQLSFPFLYRIPIAASSDIALGAGPYLGYLVKATQLTHYTDGTNRKVDLEIGNEISHDYKRLDFGARFQATLKFKHWLCILNYDLGLIDVTPAPWSYSGKRTVKNRSATISLGILL
jgi:hypothetical protein